tara:strand:- start:31013 stop:31759 length:747 start_codon:yes stop_codon:yes gene_type:complete
MLITITNSGAANGRPTSTGVNTISNIESLGEYTFTVADFTTNTVPEYSDPEDDPLKYIKITSMLSSSITTGSLTLGGVEVISGQLIYTGDISSGNLKYTAEGDVAYVAIFGFDVADTGSSSLSGLNAGIMSISVLKKENESPSSVGDGTVSTLYATTVTFTGADFTTLTLPVYADPEGDVADKLKILDLPADGTLMFNGLSATINQIMTFDEIEAGYFSYVPDTLITNLQQLEFNFAIADAGSGIFVS